LNRRLLGLVLIFALVLSLAWWVNELTRPDAIKRQVARDTPDSYAHDLLVKQYDKDGRLLQTLQTPKMVHFEERGITQLSQPVVQRYRSDAPPWRMEAEQGIANHRQETVYLPGRVVIERDGKDDFAPYRIETENLTLQTRDSYAYSSEAVNIQSGQQRLSAVGFQVWFSEPSRMKLLNQVRGRYEFK
jgi:lipopolysaccharide export system protein LptC